jgi:hypothetical protein
VALTGSAATTSVDRSSIAKRQLGGGLQRQRARACSTEAMLARPTMVGGRLATMTAAEAAPAEVTRETVRGMAMSS